MSEQKLDIKDVKEALEFGYELLITGKDVIGPPFDLAKLPAHLIPLYQKAVPAIENMGQIAPELADLDASEADELVALVISKGVESAKTQEIIKQSLECAIHAYKLVKAISE